MAPKTMELVDTMPSFSTPGEIFVRLGCEGCKHAIQIKLNNFSSEQAESIAGDLPHKLVNPSFSTTSPDLVCGDRQECPFENQITTAYADLLSATS